MTFAVYHGFASVKVASDIQIMPSPTVTVLNPDDTKPDLYKDRDGNEGKTNPFTGNSDGTFLFYVAPGRYKIKVADGEGNEDVNDDVVIGTIHGVDGPSDNDVFRYDTGNGRFETVSVSEGRLLGRLSGEDTKAISADEASGLIGNAVIVDSVSDLQSGSYPSSVTRIWLSGYFGLGTPGGGPLYRDSSDTTTSDNGGTVFVDADGVRWKAGPGFIIAEKFTVTVGSTGDFSTINDALDQISRCRPHFNPDDFTGDHLAEISLLSGFKMEEEIAVANCDLSWIVITSEDNEVSVDKSAISTDRDDGRSNFQILQTAVFFFDNARGPTIGTIFKLDSSSPATGDSLLKDGIVVYNGSHVRVMDGCGFKNATRTNIYVVSSSSCSAVGAVFDGENGTSSYGIYSDQGSSVDFREGTANGCDRHNIRAKKASFINAIRATSSGAVDGANISASEASIINASLATLSDHGGNPCIFCADGSIIHANESSISNTTNDMARALTGGKIILRDATVSGVGGVVLYARRQGVIDADGIEVTDDLSDHFIDCREGSYILAEGAIAKNGPGSGIICQGSFVACENGVFTGFGVYGLRAQNGSYVIANNADFSNSGSNALYANSGSYISAHSADLSSPGTDSASGTEGSKLIVTDATTGGGTIRVLTGSIIAANNSGGSPTVTANAISADGIIFQ